MTKSRMFATYRNLLLVAAVLGLTLCFSSLSHANVKWESVTMSPVSAPESELYQPAKGEKVFSDRKFVWSKVPEGLKGKSAWRTKLEGLDQTTVEVRGPGRVLAFLWVWDFGFLSDSPQPAKQLGDWQLVDADAANVDIYPYPLGLYAKSIGPGTNKINLKEYFGQWIIVGVEEGQTAKDALVAPPAVEVVGGRTRHNIFDLGKQATVRVKTSEADADQTVVWELYNDGEKIASGQASAADASKGIQLSVPEHPNRYWLQVGIKGRDGRSLVPLTTALPAIEDHASLEKQFPLYMWSYPDSMPEAVICPEPNYLAELCVIDQMELGANAFQTGRECLFVEAMNGMKVVSIASTKYAAREVSKTDIKGAARIIVDTVHKHGPYGKDVVAIYAADEPPRDRPEVFAEVEKLWEEEGARSTKGNRPPPPLVYCLVGYGEDKVTDYWSKANTKVRMSREYPLLSRGRHGGGLSPIAHFTAWVEKYQGFGRGIPESPLWLITQTFGQGTLWMIPDGGQARLMANLAIARGTKGLSYYSYGAHPRWGTGFVNYPAVPRDNRYAALKAFGSKIAGLSEILPKLNWMGGFEQQDMMFDVQYLLSMDGQKYIYVTNWNYFKPHMGKAYVDRIMISETGKMDSVAPVGTQLMTVPQGKCVTVSEGGFFSLLLEPGAGQMFKVISKPDAGKH